MNHPNIIRFFDVFEDDIFLYVVSCMASAQLSKHAWRYFSFWLAENTWTKRRNTCRPGQVTELCTGGELFERIIEKTRAGSSYGEIDAARIMLQLFHALDHCHKHHVVHRDLKPENLLFRDRSDDAALVVSSACQKSRLGFPRTRKARGRARTGGLATAPLHFSRSQHSHWSQFEWKYNSSWLQVIDFGLSRVFEPSDKFMQTRVGTPYCESSFAWRPLR